MESSSYKYINVEIFLNYNIYRYQLHYNKL